MGWGTLSIGLILLLLLLLELFVFGVDELVRNSARGIDGIFACEGIHRVLMRQIKKTQERVGVDGLDRLGLGIARDASEKGRFASNWPKIIRRPRPVSVVNCSALRCVGHPSIRGRGTFYYTPRAFLPLHPHPPQPCSQHFETRPCGKPARIFLPESLRPCPAMPRSPVYCRPSPFWSKEKES